MWATTALNRKEEKVKENKDEIMYEDVILVAMTFHLKDILL